MGKKVENWNEIWGWAIPKSIPADRKALAKEMLSAIMSDEEGQLALWKKTGAPPPNESLWAKIAQTDPFMRQLKALYLDPPHITHSAPITSRSWTAVHKAYNDAMTAAVTG